MKIDGTHEPKSSFLSVQKDLRTISDLLMKNERFKKLLFYTTEDALDKTKLTKEESLQLFKRNIKVTPKLKVDTSLLNYVRIGFKSFTPSLNPEFRDNIIEIDIICHQDQWNLGNFRLRPWCIAAEIDSMLNKSRLSGAGLTEFLSGDEIILTDEYSGVCLLYKVYHGEEDKKPLPPEYEDPTFTELFNKYMDLNNEQSKN